MIQLTFDVEGLRCGGCADTVREALLALNGVHAVDVTLQTTTPSTVRVEADQDLDVDVVQHALAEKGDFRVRR